MANLKWKELFKALFLSGITGYLSVAISGSCWVGIPVLILSGWLFYRFYEKMVILKRVFAEELPQDVKAGLAYFKTVFWDNNHTKIYSLIVLPIILFLGWLLFLSIMFTPSKEIALVIISCSFAIIFSFYGIWLMDDCEITDEKIGNVVVKIPKFLIWYPLRFIIWQVPKFLLKVIILTIHRAHSIELLAVSLYSLLGMIYIFIFPPFQLAPTVIFLMAGGCGIFTGLCGLGMNKVLSTALFQRAFVRVEAW